MLPTAQFLALSGDISALFPAWLSIKSRVGRRGGVKRKFQHALAGSLPRTSPSALPALPRTPGPHLQLPPSLEGVLSSWGPLAGAQGLLPSPHSRYCRAGQSEEVPGQFVHSFKVMHWGPTPTPGPGVDGTGDIVMRQPCLMGSSPGEYRSVTRE